MKTTAIEKDTAKNITVSNAPPIMDETKGACHHDRSFNLVKIKYPIIELEGSLIQMQWQF
jgi:hypothetical protein